MHSSFRRLIRDLSLSTTCVRRNCKAAMRLVFFTLVACGLSSCSGDDAQPPAGANDGGESTMGVNDSGVRIRIDVIDSPARPKKPFAIAIDSVVAQALAAFYERSEFLSEFPVMQTTNAPISRIRIVYNEEEWMISEGTGVLYRFIGGTPDGYTKETRRIDDVYFGEVSASGAVDFSGLLAWFERDGRKAKSHR